jgi:hypothetical protein
VNKFLRGSTARKKGETKLLITIEHGDTKFQAIGFFTLENAERVLESMTEKKRRTIAKASYVPFKTEGDREQAVQALQEGNFLAFLLPDGIPRFVLKNPDWLPAAEKITDEIDTQMLKDKHPTQ